MAVKKKKTVSVDLFHLSFIGEFCEILCDITNLNELTLPITGFILDKDDLYYYLSDDAKEIHRAIKIQSVKAIEIVKNRTWKEQVLNEMPIPNKEEEVN